MSDVPLPREDLSGDLYYDISENLVDRYENEGDKVHYEDAAIDVSESAAGTCLKFLSEVAIVDCPEQAHYTPPDFLTDYHNKIGDPKTEAKQEMTEALSDYDVYSEMEFLLGRDPYPINELSKQIAGSVRADEDEVEQIVKFIRILESFGIVEVGDDDTVSLVEVNGENIDDQIQDESTVTDTKESSTSEQSTEQRIQGDSQQKSGMDVDVRVSMDITEMERSDIEDKLEAVANAIENAE